MASRKKSNFRAVGAALLAAVAVGGGPCLASPAWADPDFCGAREDPFVCTARLQNGPPNAGESTFVKLVRGHVPGNDQRLLNAGRTICNQVSGGLSGRYVVSETSDYLGTSMASAGQVLDAALEYICPGVQVAG